MYVFDLDGTLIDSVNAHVAAWVEALKLLSIEADVEEVRPLMGLPAAEIAKRLLLRYTPERSLSEAELTALKNKLFIEKYIDFVKLYEDVAVIQRLPRPIAIVTSSSGYVARAVVERLGISKYIDFVLGGDEVERGKPAPDPLYIVERHFGVFTKDMIVVGDTDYDMEMANAAGAYGVCIVRQSGCSKAQRYIDNLYTLLEL